VGGELLGCTDRGVAEDLSDEFVDGQTVIETHPADVKEFRGGFADQAET
jgi:hypothetical protein